MTLTKRFTSTVKILWRIYFVCVNEFVSVLFIIHYLITTLATCCSPSASCFAQRLGYKSHNMVVCSLCKSCFISVTIDTDHTFMWVSTLRIYMVMITWLGVFGLGKFLVYLRQFSWSHTRHFPLNWIYVIFCFVWHIANYRTRIALIGFKCKCTSICVSNAFLYNCISQHCSVSAQFAWAVTQFCGVLKVFVHVVTVVLSVSVSQMAMGLNPCWRSLRTASPCHSPPSSQVSAGWRGSTAT